MERWNPPQRSLFGGDAALPVVACPHALPSRLGPPQTTRARPKGGRSKCNFRHAGPNHHPRGSGCGERIPRRCALCAVTRSRSLSARCMPLASPSCSDHISTSTEHQFCPAQRLTKVKTDLKSARRDAFGTADGADGRGDVEEWSSIASWPIGGERRTARAIARSGERIAWWML